MQFQQLSGCMAIAILVTICLSPTRDSMPGCTHQQKPQPQINHLWILTPCLRIHVPMIFPDFPMIIPHWTDSLASDHQAFHIFRRNGDSNFQQWGAARLVTIARVLLWLKNEGEYPHNYSNIWQFSWEVDDSGDLFEDFRVSKFEFEVPNRSWFVWDSPKLP